MMSIVSVYAVLSRLIKTATNAVVANQVTDLASPGAALNRKLCKLARLTHQVVNRLPSLMASGLVSFGLAISVVPSAQASEGGYPLEQAPNRLNDMAALQHGAKLFVNYCLNCHSAQSMRYNRLRDIGLSESQIKNNLLFAGNKTGDPMTVAQQAKDAKEWFGATPPDLSVITRARASSAGSGADWVYTYLRTYYRDNTRPTGWNNLVFPNVGMPHVLWQRQGPRELKTVAIQSINHPQAEHQWQQLTTVYNTEGQATVTKEMLPEHHGHASFQAKFLPKDLKQSQQFDSDVADLVGFLSYMSEPAQSQRHRLGVWVLMFLAVFAVITWRLNHAYWKDVH